MLFRTVPAIGPRYWAAISLASVAGANLGDFIVEILGWDYPIALPALALAFAAIAAADRIWRSEAFYWLMILTVRAAATNLADLAQHSPGLGRAAAPVLFAALLATLLLRPAALPDGKPRADALYWLTMLAAGAIGTTLADGMAHMTTPKTTARLLALAVGAVAVALTLSWRMQLFRAGPPRSYWAAIVAIRSWGTSAGDLLAEMLTLPVSLALSLAALATLLATWGRAKAPAAAQASARSR